MPVILATQEAEVKRITFRSQQQQIVQDPYLEYTYKRAGGVVAQVVECMSTKLEALTSNPSTKNGVKH
jgi:hypothetical protein